jgi:hypothetical protein
MFVQVSAIILKLMKRTPLVMIVSCASNLVKEKESVATSALIIVMIVRKRSKNAKFRSKKL